MGFVVEYVTLALLPGVEAGSNTSTAALRVVEGDEKGTQFRSREYNWATLSMGDINTET
jgi:hypothetical protein